MMASNPLVSVIIPTYNSASYLAEAIDSVFTQSYHTVEIIVVDDGSTDDTDAIAKQYLHNIQYVFQENKGTSAARNHGVTLAKGDLLAFLDADDLWMGDKLKQQIEAFSQQPELEAVFGQVQQFYSPELPPAERNRDAVRLAQPMAGYLPSAMVITPAAFARVGSFDAQMQINEFVDWYARAQDANLNSYMLPTIVTRRRLHRNNKGHQTQQRNAELVQLLKTTLSRRRALKE